MIDNTELRHLGGTVSPVMQLTELLLDYFTQDGVPEEVLQRIRVIKDTLQRMTQNLIKEARQELDEQTVEALFQERLTELSRILNELLLLIDDVMQTISLAHIQEIEKVIDVLNFYWEATNKVIGGI